MKFKTRGVKPAVLADLFVSVLAFVPLFFAVDVSPEVAAAIAKALGALAGVVAGPGNVELVEPGSDEMNAAILREREVVAEAGE